MICRLPRVSPMLFVSFDAKGNPFHWIGIYSANGIMRRLNWLSAAIVHASKNWLLKTLMARTQVDK
jgi:hypothetical protein